MHGHLKDMLHRELYIGCTFETHSIILNLSITADVCKSSNVTFIRPASTARSIHCQHTVCVPV